MQRDQVYPDQQSYMNVFTIYCHMTQVSSFLTIANNT